MAGSISGKGGDCTVGTGTPVQVAELTKWGFNPKCATSAWASNRSGGYKRRVAGNKDGSGSIEGKWDPAVPITDMLEEGTEVTLNLVITGTQKYLVPAIIEGIKLDVDLDSGDVVGWSADFSTNGSWTKPTATTGLMGPMRTPAAPGLDSNNPQAQAAPTNQPGPEAMPQAVAGPTAQSPQQAQGSFGGHQSMQQATQPRQAAGGASQGQQASGPMNHGELVNLVAQTVAQVLAQHPSFRQQQAGNQPVVAAAA
jgi:hypothetical protein